MSRKKARTTAIRAKRKRHLLNKEKPATLNPEVESVNGNPPDLGVHVTDSVKAKESLGP